jgi:hypothetical protein
MQEMIKKGIWIPARRIEQTKLLIVQAKAKMGIIVSLRRIFSAENQPIPATL